MTLLKKIISFIYPIKEFEIQSPINKSIEVTWNNGKLVLDSKNTNFSFGSLEHVMRFGLDKIGKPKISKMEKVLVLGVAGGSVISLLQNEFNFKGAITGIEIDEKIIAIANRFFNLEKYPNFKIIQMDAREFVSTHQLKYDLIVVDLFEDNHIPDFIFSKQFIVDLKNLLNKNGDILINTIIASTIDKKRNQLHELLLSESFKQVLKFSNVEGNNELFIVTN